MSRLEKVPAFSLFAALLLMCLAIALGGVAIARNSVPSSAPGIYWTTSASGTENARGSVEHATLDRSQPADSALAKTTGGADLAVNGNYVYWANFSGRSIGRSRLDGTEVDEHFITGAWFPVGVAVSGNYVYWTNSVVGTIGRADLDGSHVEQNFLRAGPATGTSIDGLAVDSTSIFWTDAINNRIGRADLDGSHVDRSFITGALEPTGVAVDGGLLFWTEAGADAIGRSTIAGTDVDQQCISTNGVPPGNAPEDVDAAGDFVYWTNYPAETIGRSRIDGRAIDERFILQHGVPEGIAVAGVRNYEGNVSACPHAKRDVFLGLTPVKAPYASGWGDVAPPVLSNGGVAVSGTVSAIVWSSWGGATANGQGLNPIYLPGGGYYSRPAVIQLRLSDIGRCQGKLTYKRLVTREQTKPGRPFGTWTVADANLCSSYGI